MVFYVGRKGYARVDVSATAGWSDKLQFAAYFLREAWAALTPIGAGFAVAGLVRQWRAGFRAGVAGEVVALLGCSLVLAFVLGFDYGYLKVAVFRPYPLVACGLMALWMGVGVDWALTALRSKRRVMASLATAALLLLPVCLLWRNWAVNNRAHDDVATRQARVMLAALEPNAVMPVSSDADTGPIGYLNIVEHERPDVTL